MFNFKLRDKIPLMKALEHDYDLYVMVDKGIENGFLKKLFCLHVYRFFKGITAYEKVCIKCGKSDLKK